MPTETPQSTSVRGGAEVLAEGHSLCAQLGIEDRHLERPFAIGCPRTPRSVGATSSRRHVAVREQPRQQVLANHVVRAVDVLVRVERLAERDALAPALGVGADHTDEQDFALALGAE